MNRPRLVSIPILILTLMFGLTLLGPPAAHAQNRLRDATIFNTEGEPTDPEEALALLETADLDIDFDRNVPGDCDEAATWFESLLDLLYRLGLFGESSEESGS